MRRSLIVAAVMAVGFAVVANAQGWGEPARGSATRAAFMDAIRPHAEWQLGATVEFVVHDLRVAGDVGFASLYAQRPGGGVIDIRKTPMFMRGEIDPEIMDGATLQALYRKSGATWVAVHWAIGATDVWWAYGPICREYWAVINDACVGISD
jgi:hypothetical protein